MTLLEEELLKENERLKQMLQRVNAENAQLKAFIDSINETKRTVYPPGPWKCVSCGKLTERPRRKLCPACYAKWLRRRKPHPLGSIAPGYTRIRLC